jgi:hypothetical protein
MSSNIGRIRLCCAIAAALTAAIGGACTVTGDGNINPQGLRPTGQAAQGTPRPSSSSSGNVDPSQGGTIEGGGQTGGGQTGGGQTGGTTTSSGHPTHNTETTQPTLTPKPTPTPTKSPTPVPTLNVFTTRVAIGGLGAIKAVTLYVPPATLPPASAYPNSKALTVTVSNNLGSDTSDAIWSVEPPSVATVSSSGLLTVRSTGSAKVKATSRDGLESDSFDLTVKAEGGVTAEVEF